MTRPYAIQARSRPTTRYRPAPRSHLRRHAGTRRRVGDAAPTFSIGYQKSSATLFLAKRRATIDARLKKLGVNKVDWVAFQFGSPMLEAISAGVVDIGSVGDTPPIFAQVVYAAAAPSPAHALLVQTSSPNRLATELRGKRVAFSKGSSAYSTTLSALRVAGLRYTDMQPVYLGSTEASAAFVSGNIDAWTVCGPYHAQAEAKYHARVLTDTTSDLRLASHSIYIAKREFASRYGETLAAALDELSQLERWAGEHRNDVAALAAEVTRLDVNVKKRTGMLISASTASRRKCSRSSDSSPTPSTTSS